ncbi:MAG: hypothetical protein B7Z66_05055 [Chromatiales bacterium 21-64-14]|nr:MAG: hypothetical protein B7Z66_05055 [Chromatiales bacterium 21-64-14]HQU16471.1 hypothetical protein [Gammaproteobacteria bacterium]
MTRAIDYRDWHIPLRRGRITLRAARARLASVGAGPQAIPLMVRLMENPRYRVPGVTVFHGAVDLEQHDCIHLVLGRGLLPKDEAFTIGFTMGSTHKVSTTEEALFGFVSRYLYPEVYRFGDEELRIFRDAVKLGWISGCRPLDQVDFAPYLDLPLAQVRTEIGLERELILAYYRIEKRRYPNAPESQRLV